MPRPLRVGVQLPEVERAVRWPEYRAIARTAEAVGFDSIWVGDHHLYRGDGRPERGPWEAWTLLAALAAVTERLVIGPLVACLGFHAPAILAKLAATVDEVSGGRLVVGVGAGWNRPEFDAFGLPFDHRVGRFEEAFAIVRRLLDGEHVTAAGRWWSVDDAVVLPRPARRVPLMVGSTGPRVLEATLPHVDAWNAWFTDFGNSPERFAELGEAVWERVGRAGRPADAVRRSACVLVALNRAVGQRSTEGVPPLGGTPSEIAAGLRAFARAGADETILVVDPIDEDAVAELGDMLTLLDES